MTILDHQVEATEIKTFLKMLDRLDEITEGELTTRIGEWKEPFEQAKKLASERKPLGPPPERKGGKSDARME